MSRTDFPLFHCGGVRRLAAWAMVGLWIGLGAAPALAQTVQTRGFRAVGPADRGVLTLATAAGLAQDLGAVNEALIEQFPLADGSAVTMRLARFEPMTPDARFVVMTPEGEREAARPTSTFWSGALEENPETRVYLAVSDDRVDGLILSEDRTWIISSGPGGEALPTVVYDLRTISPDLVSVAGGGCSALIPPGGLPEIAAAAGNGGGLGDRGAPCRIATIAIETDHETTVAIGGDPAAAADYLTRLMGAVSVIYQRDLNVNLQIPYMRLWTTPEDPWTQTEMGAQLGEFRDHWAANMGGVRRTLAHFLTFRGLGGGVAWVGVLCNNEYGFGLSSGVGGGFPYPLRDRDNRNWPLFVTAHELGHNFGTGHTHDSYDPVIDGCGNGDCSDARNGTIMSYCHGCSGGMRNISLTFGPRVIERIHAYLDTIPAPCGMTGSLAIRRHPASATVRLGQPVTLTAQASGPGVVAFRWTRNGTPIPGGEDGTLEFASAALEDAGAYAAEAWTPCASRQTNAATLTVLCRADFNRDGFTDFFDYDAFVACYEGAGCPAGESADMNADGFVDFFDYDAFVVAFESGC
jgi:hypothetical protein